MSILKPKSQHHEEQMAMVRKNIAVKNRQAEELIGAIEKEELLIKAACQRFTASPCRAKSG